jgi:hypothetical protein
MYINRPSLIRLQVSSRPRNGRVVMGISYVSADIDRSKRVNRALRRKDSCDIAVRVLRHLNQSVVPGVTHVVALSGIDEFREPAEREHTAYRGRRRPQRE